MGHNAQQAAIFRSRVSAAYQWIQQQERLFTADQIAAITGVTIRTAYRYLKEVKKMDGGLRGAAGVGYLYRRRT